MVDQQNYLEKKNIGKWIKWLILGLVCVNLFVWMAVMGNRGSRDLEVWFFDVGQGDAAFAQLPNGVQILIDGGPNVAVLAKLARAMPFYDRDIDWVILSHTDRDHLAGLLAVLKNYQVRNIIWSGIGDEDAEDDEWRRLIESEGAAVVKAVAGNKTVLVDSPAGGPDCVLEILAPAANAAGADLEQNELSVAVKLTYGKRSFIFTGDAASAAGGFIETASQTPADVLKVAHHGSKYSTDVQFLAELMPAAAVISSGAGNAYGHPAPEVLEMMAKYDIKTLRTDKNGDIVFRTNGENIFVSTQK